jgi:hypothetical protein
MAKEIEKSILQELKRFSEINHNSDNLNEQKISVVGNAMADTGSGFEQQQGSSDRLNKFKAQQEIGEQEVPDEDVDLGDEEVGDEELDIDVEAEDGGVEDDLDMDLDTGGEDTTELDVTDLVSKQDETNTELSDQKDILSKNTESLDDLMTKLSDLETQLSSMEDVATKISSLEDKLEEYRPRTPEEELGLRKHDSGPYNKTLSDFFTDKEEVFDKTGKKQYILTKDAVEDYSDVDIQKSFGDPDAEDEE